MEHFLQHLTLVIISLLPCTLHAQDLTPDEIAFLKSLSGKWNPSADYSGEWGTWCYDISIKYMNGSLKISYPSYILEKDGSRHAVSNRIVTANYVKSSESISFNYKCVYYDAEPNTITVYITIPIQSDIEDSMILYRSTSFSNNGSKVNEGEIMYYKH